MTNRLAPPDRNTLLIRARELRRRSTLPEGLLWRELRKRPNGFKFRRQHPMGRYIVDFYCPAAKLVIEIDGQGHSMGDRPQQDARRDLWMTGEGLRVLRFDATDVLRDLDSVITEIIGNCHKH